MEEKSKIQSIIAIDWCPDMLEMATTFSFRSNVKLVQMDATNLQYIDNSFDTVLDTFGLQSSHDYKLQYEEMKRVCKKGGKILIMELGESYWKHTNYKILKQAKHELAYRGQLLFLNYDDMILNDKEVKIIKRRRKINGRLFIYVLEKL